MTQNNVNTFAAAVFFLLLGTACGAPDSKTNDRDSADTTVQAGSTVSVQTTGDSVSGDGSAGTAPTIEAVVFEVRGSSNRMEGYGYDLVINGKKTIHQPTIPAVQGNKSFVTEQEAKAVGELAASRMRKTGDLPTINVKDLDSLKITYR
jgi:hypothetical protein